MMSNADILVTKILEEKIRLEKSGKRPKIILLGEKEHEMLQTEWIETIRSLPWGDSLAYELEKRAKSHGEIFLGNGSLLDLWVICVNTIKGFEVR